MRGGIDIDRILKKSKKEEVASIEEATSVYQKSFAEEELETLKQDRKERKKYAKSTFIFLKGFTSTLLCIIIASGAEWLNISDSVLITLITSSLASIVGIFILVMKYLFSKKID